MNIYNYDSEGEYLSTASARVVKGEVIIPANATTIEPPTIKKGKVLVFVDGKWNQVTDNRGKAIYNCLTQAETVQTELGDITEGYTLIKPVNQFDVWNGSAWVKDETKELYHYQKALMATADAAQTIAEECVYGYKYTPMQLERYFNKYTRAKAGEFEPDKNEMIITKHEASSKAVSGFYDMIELFRETVADYIKAGEYTKVASALELAREFTVETTIEEVKEKLSIL